MLLQCPSSNFNLGKCLGISLHCIPACFLLNIFQVPLLRYLQTCCALRLSEGANLMKDNETLNGSLFCQRSGQVSRKHCVEIVLRFFDWLTFKNISTSSVNTSLKIL